MSRPVSQFSAVNIGLQKPSREKDSITHQFKEEAQRVTKYLEGVHHSQKNSHNQVMYSETVKKLSKFDQEPAVYTRRQPPEKTFSSSHSMVVSRQNETTDQMNKNAYSEHDLNMRKRAYNREVGRVAVVDSVSDDYVCAYGCIYAYNIEVDRVAIH
jgi:arylamine N-acetyltransferase